MASNAESFRVLANVSGSHTNVLSPIAFLPTVTERELDTGRDSDGISGILFYTAMTYLITAKFFKKKNFFFFFGRAVYSRSINEFSCKTMAVYL